MTSMVISILPVNPASRARVAGHLAANPFIYSVRLAGCNNLRVPFARRASRDVHSDLHRSPPNRELLEVCPLAVDRARQAQSLVHTFCESAGYAESSFRVRFLGFHNDACRKEPFKRAAECACGVDFFLSKGTWWERRLVCWMSVVKLARLEPPGIAEVRQHGSHKRSVILMAA